VIRLDGVRFSYTGEDVVSDISLEVGRGSFVGIMGPNGAGKTTLLKLIAGILSPSAGRIYISGVDLSLYSRRRLAREIAFVPQFEAIPFSFSAWEVVLMGRAPHIGRFGIEGREDIMAAREAMLCTGTLHLKERCLNELSGGERQLVLIARAIASGSPVILLDEPTAFLDIKHEIRVMDVLRALNDGGVTIVAAMHDINLAVAYCRKILLLKGGRVFRFGSAEEVVTYANLREVFETDVYVGISEIDGRPYYVPIRR